MQGTMTLQGVTGGTVTPGGSVPASAGAIVAATNGGTGVHGVLVNVTAGTTYTVNVEVSIDGTTWKIIGSLTNAAPTPAAFHIGSWPMARITVTVDGSSDTVAAWQAVLLKQM